MWRTRNGLYLEPGEVAVLAALAGGSTPVEPVQHPRDLVLAALTRALDRMSDGVGVVVRPASPSVVRGAARAYVRPPAGRAETPAGGTDRAP